MKPIIHSFFILLGINFFVLAGLSALATAHDSGQDTAWTCIMHPEIRQDESGVCRLCHMDLVPLPAREDNEVLSDEKLSGEDEGEESATELWEKSLLEYLMNESALDNDTLIAFLEECSSDTPPPECQPGRDHPPDLFDWNHPPRFSERYSVEGGDVEYIDGDEIDRSEFIRQMPRLAAGIQACFNNGNYFNDNDENPLELVEARLVFRAIVIAHANRGRITVATLEGELADFLPPEIDSCFEAVLASPIRISAPAGESETSTIRMEFIVEYNE